MAKTQVAKLSDLSNISTVTASINAEIGTIRERISDLRLRQANVEDTAVSSAERESRADEIIAEAQRQVRERDFFGLLAAPEERFSLSKLRERLDGAPHIGIHGFDAFAAFATINPTALKTLMLDQANSEASDRGPVAGLTPSQRSVALADIADELIRLEALEEQIIRRLESHGFSYQRRENAEPAVVLAFDAELATIAPMEA